MSLARLAAGGGYVSGVLHYGDLLGFRAKSLLLVVFREINSLGPRDPLITPQGKYLFVVCSIQIDLMM